MQYSDAQSMSEVKQNTGPIHTYPVADSGTTVQAPSANVHRQKPADLKLRFLLSQSEQTQVHCIVAQIYAQIRPALRRNYHWKGPREVAACGQAARVASFRPSHLQVRGRPSCATVSVGKAHEQSMATTTISDAPCKASFARWLAA